MRICVACSGWGEWPVCSACRAGMHPAPTVWLDERLQVSAGFAHSGTARKLVHLLKYAGIRQVAHLLAEAMVTAMPADVTALVPVPRAVMRRVRYGLDPAVVLAELVGRETGLPVVPALRARLWWPSNAGISRMRRSSPGFSVVQPAPVGGVLIDDVATTGMTLLSAAKVTQLSRALTATRAGGSYSG